MKGCIFCKISRREIPSHVVYEGDAVFAFLDIHPINPGHILVIPKKHESDFYRLDEGNYRAVMDAVKKLSELVDMKIHPKKVGLMVAGWDVPHAHIHIVPMQEYHDITSKSLIDGKQANPTEEELTETLALLRR
jgi:histidine triad (HIT) family protein